MRSRSPAAAQSAKVGLETYEIPQRSHLRGLVIMSDAVRVAIHLERKVNDPLFIKVVEDRKKVTHVV
jgi:hypothetical protein